MLSSNNITWFNLDLPSEAKEAILKEIKHIEAESVQIEEKTKPVLTITLMTSPSCSLCTVAKAVIAGVSAQVTYTPFSTAYTYRWKMQSL